MDIGLRTITVPHDGTDSSRRRALSRLDELLTQLEEANLREERHPPERAASELRALGVLDPELRTPTELINMVLEAQEPLLQPIPSNSIVQHRRAVVREALGRFGHPRSTQAGHRNRRLHPSLGATP
jgi:hypothetical protein